MDRETMLEKCRDLAYEGKEYHEIKAVVENWGLEEEDRRAVLRRADEFIAQYQLAEQERSNALLPMLLGGAAILLAVALMILTAYLLVAAFVLLTGAYILWKGWQRYSQPPGAELRTRWFKQKRFDKF